MLKRMLKILLPALLFSQLICIPAYAGLSAHYQNGGEGIKAATIPPPGFYFRQYNMFYKSDDLIDANGDTLNNSGFDLTTYAMANRFIWVTDKKLLGADFLMNVVIPLVYVDFELGSAGITDDHFGIGDIYIEPFALAWHGARYDAALGLCAYAPTGNADDSRPAYPGKDYWTGMINTGVTLYFDTDKTWSASVLARYEVHSEKNNTDIRAGDDFHFEWGIGKTIARLWDVGLTGYCQWQVSDDRGDDVTWDRSVHDRVYGIGPEVSVFLPNLKLGLTLRNQWEFGAVDRSEGNMTTLVLTKTF
ncbi:MAG: transporter [Desulfobacterales bacterium]|nr:transporter [Desulfobacterales bacterium]MDD4392624.1 transporter [Desulfobacterales bacterium]